MTKRIFLLVAMVFMLLGCGPPWKVVRQAVPNPLLGKKTFGLAPIDFTGLRVGDTTEQGYLAEKDEESRSNWTGDKKAMNEEFAKKCIAESADNGITVSAGGAADYILAPKVTWIEPGFYVGVASKNSEVHLTIQIKDKEGNVVDEVTTKHGTTANLVNPAVGNRLRDDAEGLGAIAALYLQHRSVGEGG